MLVIESFVLMRFSPVLPGDASWGWRSGEMMFRSPSEQRHVNVMLSLYERLVKYLRGLQARLKADAGFHIGLSGGAVVK
jgi:hypothetical protein